MRRLIILLVLIFNINLLYGNRFQIVKKEYDLWKYKIEQYNRRKNFKYSELEALSMKEKMLTKKKQINEVFREIEQEYYKLINRKNVLEDLSKIVASQKRDYKQKYEAFFNNRAAVNELELKKLEHEIKRLSSQENQYNREVKFLKNRLKENEYNLIENRDNNKTIINLVEEYYDMLLKVKERELKIAKIEKQGDENIKIKKINLEMIDLKKVQEIKELKQQKREKEVKVENLTDEIKILKEKEELLEKEEILVESEVDLGTNSQEKLFKKKIELMELKKKIAIKSGEKNLLELELKR